MARKIKQIPQTMVSITNGTRRITGVPVELLAALEAFPSEHDSPETAVTLTGDEARELIGLRQYGFPVFAARYARDQSSTATCFWIPDRPALEFGLTYKVGRFYLKKRLKVSLGLRVTAVLSEGAGERSHAVLEQAEVAALRHLQSAGLDGVPAGDIVVKHLEAMQAKGVQIVKLETDYANKDFNDSTPRFFLQSDVEEIAAPDITSTPADSADYMQRFEELGEAIHYLPLGAGPRKAIVRVAKWLRDPQGWAAEAERTGVDVTVVPPEAVCRLPYISCRQQVLQMFVEMHKAGVGKVNAQTSALHLTEEAA